MATIHMSIPFSRIASGRMRSNFSRRMVQSRSQRLRASYCDCAPSSRDASASAAARRVCRAKEEMLTLFPSALQLPVEELPRGLECRHAIGVEQERVHLVGKDE